MLEAKPLRADELKKTTADESGAAARLGMNKPDAAETKGGGQAPKKRPAPGAAPPPAAFEVRVAELLLSLAVCCYSSVTVWRRCAWASCYCLLLSVATHLLQ